MAQSPVNPTELISQLPPTQELVDYYRQTIDQFEDERKDLIERMNQTQIAQDEYHRLRYLMFKKDEEIEELQKALKDAHLHILEERGEVLRLNAIIDELQIQEQEDRRRIQDLLALTQPVEEEVTFFRDQKPNKVSVHSRHQKPQTKQFLPERNEHDANMDMLESMHPKIQYQSSKSTRPVRVLRTVFFPDEKNESILSVIESLRRQLEEQKQLYETKIFALMEDRRISEEEYKASNFNLRQENISLLQQLEQTKNWLREANINFVTEKRESQTKEQLYQQEFSKQNQLQNQLEMQVSNLEKQLVEEKERIRAEAEAQIHDQVNFVRQQTLAKEDIIDTMKARQQRDSVKSQERVKELTERLETLRSRYHKLSSRRTFELEGFAYDVSNIRKEMRELENALLRLKAPSNLHRAKQTRSSTPIASPRTAERIVRDAENIKGKINTVKGRIYDTHV